MTISELTTVDMYQWIVYKQIFSLTTSLILYFMNRNINNNTLLISYSPIYLETNAHWFTPDAEFTRSKHLLSAVWPSLRHGSYQWKVVSSSEIERWAFTRPGEEQKLLYETYHCAQPEVLACGHTKVKS